MPELFLRRPSELQGDPSEKHYSFPVGARYAWPVYLITSIYRIDFHLFLLTPWASPYTVNQDISLYSLEINHTLLRNGYPEPPRPQPS